MTTIELLLYLLLGVFAVATVALTYLFSKMRSENQASIDSLQKQLAQKQSKAFGIGQSTLRGGLMELMGDFESLVHYDQLAVLSTATSQASIDLLGIVLKDDEEKGDARIDFIEFKSGRFSSDTTKHKKNTYDLSPKEKVVKKLVDEKKVNYVIKEIDLPKWFEAKERI